MDVNHPLKTLLQYHLASDGSAVLHLPHTLSVLTAEAFEPSSHLQKWIARINSLIHAKDEGARWAGLTLAFRTSVLAKTVILECAQSWVTAALTLLSKNESVPVLKACIRLLRLIFTAAATVPEFQRQVSTPNVPKFTAALGSLAEKHVDVELKVLSLNTLSHLIANYPTLHRASQSTLSTLSLRYLNGSSPKPMPQRLLEASSGLFTALHHTGGKVGAAGQWRKSIEETLQFAWNAFSNIRTTYSSGLAPAATSQDPLVTVPLHMDRLRAAVVVLSDLLRTNNPRPVAVPVGSIVRLCASLLSCTIEGEVYGPIDRTTRYLEESSVDQIHSYGSFLVQNLAACLRQALVPHSAELYLNLTILLEQKLPAPQRVAVLRAASSLLENCPGQSDSQLTSRLMRAILPSLTYLMSPQSEITRDNGNDADTNAMKSRKGKKRSRGYEGDEVFKVSREILCPTKEDGESLLLTLDVIRQLLESCPLSLSIQSLTGRVVLALLASLPQIPAALLSQDPVLHVQLSNGLQRAASTLASGTTSNMSKSLGLFIHSSLQLSGSTGIWKDVDLMLHPRVPPLVRALPHIESLSLFQAEESQEELETRRNMAMVTINEAPLVPQNTQSMTSSVSSQQANYGTAFTPTTTFAPSTGLQQDTQAPTPRVTASATLDHQEQHKLPSNEFSVRSERIPPPQAALPSKQPPLTTMRTSTSPVDSKAIAGPSAPVVREVLSPPTPGQTVTPAVMGADEDEEMPGIDMESDSE